MDDASPNSASVARVEHDETRGHGTLQDRPGFRCAQSGLRATAAPRPLDSDGLRCRDRARAGPTAGVASRNRGDRIMQAVFPLALAVVAGFCVVIQQVLNANLRTVLGSAAWSA